MARIKIVLPDGQSVATGVQITFVAPCGCTDTTYLQINDIDYRIVDAMGYNVAGTSSWTTGALIVAVLDVENKKAYVLNAGALLLSNTSNTLIGSLNINSNLVVSGTATLNGNATFGGQLILSSECYGDSLPSDSEATAGRLFFKKI